MSTICFNCGSLKEMEDEGVRKGTQSKQDEHPQKKNRANTGWDYKNNNLNLHQLVSGN